MQTQLLAVAQSDQAGLSEHIRELKDALAQPRAVEENGLWSALQTNRPVSSRGTAGAVAGNGLQLASSGDYVVVSKDSAGGIQMTQSTTAN